MYGSTRFLFGTLTNNFPMLHQSLDPRRAAGGMQSLTLRHVGKPVTAPTPPHGLCQHLPFLSPKQGPCDFSTFRRTRHTIIRNTESTVVLKKQQILKTTGAFNSFNSFSQPWQSSVEIKVLRQGAVLHFQKVTLTWNVSP